MLYEIKNDKLTVKINSKGAEITSVTNNKIGNEFIWTADPKYWASHGPNLFPFVGRLEEEAYTYGGKRYHMLKHGLAKYYEFNLAKITENCADFAFVSNEETLEMYPFNFEFHVIYKLNEETLTMEFKVLNKDTKEMIFAYGYHPGFNVPINGKGSFSDYYLEFTRSDYLNRRFERGLDIFEDVETHFEGKKLQFTDHTFDEDLFYKNTNDVVILKTNLSNDYVKVEFENMTSLGLWKANGTDAPYICIEPWHGFPGPANRICELENQIETVKLESNGVYSNSIKITFHAE